MADRVPTIKGMFVKSHVAAVRRLKGEEGVRALAAACGLPLDFRNSDDVPVHDEIRIIECALDLLTGGNVPPGERAFEAGRLHFRNFTTTPLARIIFALFRRNFRLMMVQAGHLGGHVFEGIRFSSVEEGPTRVIVRMENADYPIDHFRGLFQEWMLYSGAAGTVEARRIDRGIYEYRMEWTPS